MANEIRAFQYGATTLFSVVRNAAGQVWYPVGGTFEAWGTAARTAVHYAIALVNKSGGMFVGDFDAGIDAGTYIVVTHQQAGGAAADTDPAVYKEDGYWDTSTWSANILTPSITAISTLIGTPVALDGGSADLSGMLTKMVDDNGGADFRAGRDSLSLIRTRGDLAWTTGAGSAAQHIYTIDTIVRTVGDDDGGTSADVDVVDEVYFVTGEVNATTLLEVDAVFTAVVGEDPHSVSIWGYYAGSSSHYMTVKAYNYVDSSWEDLGVIGNSSVPSFYQFSINPQHISGAAVISIKLLHSPPGTGIVSHALYIDKIIVGTTEASLLHTNVDSILADTNELQTDWTNAGRLDTILDAIVEDTDEIQGKLPDDYIMGSSVTTSMDDEINAIVANLGQVHTTEDESPGGGSGGASTTSGIAEGC